MTTSPSLCNKPSTGGLSPASVPRPRLPFKRLRRPLRPAFLPSAGNPLCPATIYTRRYHTLIAKIENEGYPSKVASPDFRKEPLYEPLCQIFPKRETISCIDWAHNGRIPGALALLPHLLSEEDGALHAEREEAW